jgi:hypothetical protein
MWEKIVDMADLRRIKFGTTILRYAVDERPVMDPPAEDSNYEIYKIFSFTGEGIDIYKKEKGLLSAIGFTKKTLLHKDFKELFDEKVWWYEL